MTIGLLRILVLLYPAQNTWSGFPGNHPSPWKLLRRIDWSSASYWFSVCAMGHRNRIILPNLGQTSLQADSVLPQIYKNLEGWIVRFKETGHFNSANLNCSVKELEYNFINCPDIAQTVAHQLFCAWCRKPDRALKHSRLKPTRLKRWQLNWIIESADVHYSDTHLGMNRTIHRKGWKTRYKYLWRSSDGHELSSRFLLCPKPLHGNESVVSSRIPRFWDDLKTPVFNVHCPENGLFRIG